VSRERPPLLKGQGVRFASVGVGLVIGLGVMLTVFTVGSDEPLPVGLLVGIGAGALVLALGSTLVGLLIGRRAFGQRLELALRPAGETRWQHGRVEATPGRLEFTPYRWQVRFISGSPTQYEVVAVGDDTGRRPSKKQLWSVNPALHVIEVETDRGTLQLGLQGHQVDDVRHRLQPEAPRS
jgi:hypothetical protein